EDAESPTVHHDTQKPSSVVTPAVANSRRCDSSDDDDDEDVTCAEDSGRKRRSESLPPSNNIASSASSGAAADDGDARRPTMWLGTEDGFIHVYNCSDSIRIKKNKFKFQLGSSVHSIIPLDNRVFASLASGEVVVFTRHDDSWSAKVDREVVMVSSAAAPVIKMILVAGKLWCAAANTIKILNTNTLQLEHSFTVAGGEGTKCGGVTCMVSAGQGAGTAAPTKLLVISGGDGSEDFRNANASELAGRDDSTNHLLMWHV
ncbi:hypothetical protein HAZT_HAZT008850, partial [Hyalella azteca]